MLGKTAVMNMKKYTREYAAALNSLVAYYTQAGDGMSALMIAQQARTEAKKLLQKNMPVVLERTTFYIGKSKCVIINTDKQLRIMYDSPEEFISYDFV